MNTDILSVGKLEELFNLESNKFYNVDYVFQIIDFTRSKIESNRFLYKLILSDSIIKYENFVFIVDESNGINLEVNDLVKLSKINQVITNQNSKLVFLVDLSYFGKLVIRIGNPISYNEKLKLNTLNFTFGNNNNSNNNIPPNNGSLQKNGNNHQLQNNNLNNFNFQFNSQSHLNSNQNNDHRLHGSSHQNSSYKNSLKDAQNVSYIYTPISQLNSQNKMGNVILLDQINTFSKNFSIIVRVLNKTELIPYVTKSHGVYLSVFVIDSSNHEMEIKVFNSGAEKAFKLLEEKLVYKISGLYVKLNDKRYSAIKSDYCLYLEDNFSIEKLPEDPNIKLYSYTFTKIDHLQGLSNSTMVDIVAKVLRESELSKKNTKHGEMDFKKIYIGDNTKHEVEVTLWGEQAKLEHCKENMDIFIFKHLVLSEFNGCKTLTTSKKTFMYQDSQLNEVKQLTKFFATYSGGEFTSLSKPHKSVETKFENFNYTSLESIYDQIKDMCQDSTITSNINNINNQFQESLNIDKKRVFKVKAQILNFTHSEKNFYVGCTECRKKSKDTTFTYTCINCNKYHEKPHYIYFFRFYIKDNTRDCMVDALGEVANDILGMTAEEYRNTLIENDCSKFDEIFPNLERKQMNFLLKPKFDYFNGETCVKINLVKAERFGDNKNKNKRNSEEYERDNNVVKIY